MSAPGNASHMTEKTFSAPPGDTSASVTSAMSALTGRSSERKIWRGENEAPAGHQILSLARLEFVDEVPGQYEKKVRPGRARIGLRDNRNMGPDRDFAPFGRVAFGGRRDHR